MPVHKAATEIGVIAITRVPRYSAKGIVCILLILPVFAALLGAALLGHILGFWQAACWVSKALFSPCLSWQRAQPNYRGVAVAVWPAR